MSVSLPPGPFPTVRTERSRIKRGRASLIGGLATGACVLTLWLAGAASLGLGGAGTSLAGLMVAAAVAAWIRLADL